MKNIELKVKVNDFKEIEKSLKIMNAKFNGILYQKDIYYNCPKGRLKIREINKKQFELIFYQRPNQAINKLSIYKILPIEKNLLKTMKVILMSAFGIQVTVTKRRRLWTAGNTRIHLDTVDKLGRFLELETVLNKISVKEGKNEYREIYEKLQLNKFNKIKNSYSDLISK